MWIIIIIFFILIFPSLCDSDKKSCLSGIASIVIIGVVLYGLSILNNIWDSAIVTITYIILALITIVIIWMTIQACIRISKRNKEEELIKKILSNTKCPYCQSDKTVFPEYYRINRDMNQLQLYCQDCGETWVYKEE